MWYIPVLSNGVWKTWDTGMTHEVGAFMNKALHAQLPADMNWTLCRSKLKLVEKREAIPTRTKANLYHINTAFKNCAGTHADWRVSVQFLLVVND